MGRHLLNSFAVEDPEGFARLLGASEDIAGMLSLLTEVETGLECEVVARLSPELAHRLLDETPDPVLSAWLETGPTDAGRRLLSNVNRDRAARLIQGIRDRSKRRALRRLAGYSAGTIGQLVQVQMSVIRQDFSAERIRTELQRNSGALEGPVVVERNDGKVLGVLDLSSFVQNTRDDVTAADFCIPVKPLQADAPLPSFSSLKRSGEWAKLTSMPAVDHKQRLLGYVTLAALERAATMEKEGGLFLESLLELVKQYWEFMQYALVLILGRRHKP